MEVFVLVFCWYIGLEVLILEDLFVLLVKNLYGVDIGDGVLFGVGGKLVVVVIIIWGKGCWDVDWDVFFYNNVDICLVLVVVSIGCGYLIYCRKFWVCYWV